MNKDIKNVDFEGIKQNLISFLKSQDKFSGYNFEASALNILLDVLSYNTYYQTFYNNMTFSEMFLDTATKRSSVVSLAKMLGYRPASAKSSTCVVNISTSNPIENPIPKYSIFRAQIDNETFEFVSLSDYFLKPATFNSNGTVSTLATGPVEIKEGKLRTLSYIHDEGLPFKKYIIPYDNIDLTTLEVKVQASENDNYGSDDQWLEAKDITKVTGDSLVYFSEETPYGYYSINFGDGVLGKKLSDGNKITINVLETVASAANGLGENDIGNTFTTTVGNGYNVSVVVPSYGGEEKESKESIKLKAPKSFTAQERAVTLDDYKNIILKDFSNITSVSCWGGEDNEPPQYGKVFLSIKPKSGNILSLDEKASIIRSLVQGKNIVGIEPVIVDPEVIYLLLDVEVKIEPSKLKITSVSLENKINKQILLYIKNNISVFDGDFYPNELINEIDSLDKSIFSINLNVTMEKRIIPSTIEPTKYIIQFKNPILKTNNCTTPVITTSTFYYYDPVITSSRLCRIEDSDSLLNIIYYDENNKKQILKKCGTVDYDKGIITLIDFQPVSLFDSNPLSIYASPSNKDIYSQKNNLLTIDELDQNSIKIDIVSLPYRGNI
jgi:hypothetical protein